MRAIWILLFLSLPVITACQQKADTPPAPKTIALTAGALQLD